MQQKTRQYDSGKKGMVFMENILSAIGGIFIISFMIFRIFFLTQKEKQCEKEDQEPTKEERTAIRIEAWVMLIIAFIFVTITFYYSW